MNSFFRGAAVALAMAGSMVVAGAAQAQSINFQGTVAGCFGAGCLPGSTSTDKGLTYTGSTFNVTTSGGFVSIGNAPGTPNFNNLGSYALSGTAAVYTGDVFTLAVTFTAPSGTSPSTGSYSGTLIGQVASVSNGGVQISFNNSTLPFSFPGGGFTLTVNNVAVTAGNTVAGSGFIIATPGPIAGAGLPVLLGLAGFAFYRRRSAANAA